MPYLEILRKLAVPLAVITLVLTIWFSGDHHGQNVTQAKWDAQKQRDRAALEAEHERVFTQEQAYADQLARAKSESDHNRAELARLRDLPHPRVVCVVTPNGNHLSGLQTDSNPTSTPGAGELPQKPGLDIGVDLYGEADRADALVEAFRDFMKRLPQ